MNLRATRLIARSVVRRQRGSLALLVLLVASVTGVVLAGAAGAHRTATVLDRFLVDTNQSDLGAYAMGLRAADAPEFFGAVPGVADAASVDTFLAQPTSPGVDFDFVIASSPDGRWGTDINRVLVREGRLPAADRVDEVALNRPATEALGLGVGDTLEMQTISPETFEVLVAGLGGIDLDGPTIAPTIVGVIEAGEDLQGSSRQSSPLALASPAFGREYDSQIAVSGSTTAIVSDDPAAVERVRSAAAEFPQSGVATAEEEWVATTRSAINVVTAGLVIFTGIALLAGAMTIGQSVSRQLSGNTDALVVARAAGLTRVDRATAVAAPVFGAAVAGSLIGALLAIGASGWFPLAIARSAEPEPGVRIDLPILAVGVLAFVALVAGWSIFGALRADRRAVGPTSDHAARALPLIGFGSSVAPRLGVRLAINGGPRRLNLPTRSVLVGTAAAFAGCFAVVVFAASLDAAVEAPSNFGWTWSTRPDFRSGDDPAATLQELALDDDLQAVGAVFQSNAQMGAATVPMQAFLAVKGTLAPPVASGRLPTSPSEVALGSSTLAALDRSIGDTIDLNVPGQPSRELTVVGEVVGNQLTDLPDLGSVAVVTTDAASALAGVTEVAELDGAGFAGSMLLTYRDGIDAKDLEARLERDHQLAFVAYSRPAAPGRLLNMSDMRPLLAGIALFFAGIGTLAFIHLLVVSTRRRSHEFGILRALGLVRAQLRSVIWFQGVTIIAVGLVVGLPLGVALGRWAWRAALDGVGMIASPTAAWAGLGAIIVIAFGLTSLISLVPGTWAARVRPATQLRAE